MFRRSSIATGKVGLGVTAAALALSLFAPTASGAAEGDTSTAVMVQSIAADGINIDIQVHKPAAASADNPVPVILHSHGWGGSKSTGVGTYTPYLDAGFGVVSITQRGHGRSGGLRAVEDPNKEGQDMIAVVDYVAGLDWVLHEEIAEDSPFNNDVRNGDPVLGAFGGSYGGGYQYVLAMTEQRDFGGETRVDAMAPDITWHNLNTALAPSDVPRSAWLTLLYGTAVGTVERYVDEGFAFGAATGQYADGTVPGVVDLKREFATHGPAGYRNADGEQMQLDIPMLITQGFSDNLFNFNEAWDNFTVTLTDDARAKSQLVGHNGGHALPNVYPVGYASGGDHCGGLKTSARVDFFTAAFTGGDTRVVGDGSPFQYATASGECLQLDYSDLDFEATYSPEEVDPTGTLGPATGNVTMAGAPISLKLAEGPLTIGGVPELSGDAYGLGVDQRVFFTLAKGTSPANAQTIQNNVMPYRSLLPSLGESFSLRLPGMAETIDAGENLYLTISPTSDMFFMHGSRTPGAVGFNDLSVTIPTVVE